VTLSGAHPTFIREYDSDRLCRCQRCLIKGAGGATADNG